MTKKFVKTDLTSLGRKEEKQTSNYYRTSNNDRGTKPRPRPPSLTQERLPTIDLRKYFEVFPSNEEIKSLVEKFPGFFTEMSIHPEQLRNGKPQNDTFKIGSAFNPNQQIEE